MEVPTEMVGYINPCIKFYTHIEKWVSADAKILHINKTSEVKGIWIDRCPTSADRQREVDSPGAQ